MITRIGRQKAFPIAGTATLAVVPFLLSWLPDDRLPDLVQLHAAAAMAARMLSLGITAWLRRWDGALPSYRRVVIPSWRVRAPRTGRILVPADGVRRPEVVDAGCCRCTRDRRRSRCRRGDAVVAGLSARDCQSAELLPETASDSLNAEPATITSLVVPEITVSPFTLRAEHVTTVASVSRQAAVDPEPSETTREAPGRTVMPPFTPPSRQVTPLRDDRHLAVPGEGGRARRGAAGQHGRLEIAGVADVARGVDRAVLDGVRAVPGSKPPLGWASVKDCSKVAFDNPPVPRLP